MANSWKCYVFFTSNSWHQVTAGSEMEEALENVGNEIAIRAGAGYKTKVLPGKIKATAILAPETTEAYFDNLRNNTLLKAGGV